jgi:adenine-specific DNA-methyltransferase
MKYMGSKRLMLANGLGKILATETLKSKRFADLFVGSGAVAWHVAETTKCQVLAADLQVFAVALAEAVITRRRALDADKLWKAWSRSAQQNLRRDRMFHEAEIFEGKKWQVARRRNVALARNMCADGRGPITQAYGGHYFSPKQALLLDAFRRTLPSEPAAHSVALAALICAASECAAAPGHTAQPFQPTTKAAVFLFEAWRRDIAAHVKAGLERICPKRAGAPGSGTVCNAETLAAQLNKGDLAFIDPPYSGVHYSRFYHVLETIARGACSETEGVGRYPLPRERPKSEFSVKSKSKAALERLFTILAERGTRAVLTFPREETSNGLSGRVVQAVAKKYFKCSRTVVNGRFSTLGGNSRNRKARIPAYEIVLVLSPD